MLRNCSIGTRLGLGFGGVLLLLCVFAVTTLISLQAILKSTSHVKNESLPYCILAEEMAFDVVQVQQFLTDVGATREADAYKEAEEAAANFSKGIDRFREMFRRKNDGKAMAAIDSLESEFGTFYNLGRQMADAYVKEGTEGGNRHMRDFDKASEVLAEKVLTFKKSQVDEATAMAGHVEKSVADLRIFLIALAALGVVAGAVVACCIARSIRRPLGAAISSINQLAAGDLTAHVQENGPRETAELAHAVNRMAQDMKEVVGALKHASAHVASASAELVAQADQMACGAEEVSAQTQTVATASEEMAATAHDIATTCTMAAESSRAAKVSASTGADIIGATVEGMHRIAEKVRLSSANVETLGVRSSEIEQIVSVIEDIADQTNLLALNASIEAARAGEQGRGFAVVADEVRALAERTGKATHQITAMIRSIQQETTGAVKAMEEGVVEVSSGTQGAIKSSHALKEILQQIEAITGQVNQIAVASEQQNATTIEISNNIHQVTTVIEASSRGAEETATSAKTLSSLAEELKTIVGRFKVA